jgi:tetratricopeptide (TPR) repeat protein
MEAFVKHLSVCGQAFGVALMLAGCGASALSQSTQWQTALSLEQQGRYAEAETAWTVLSKEQPSNPTPYAYLGLLDARQQHYPEAIAYYRKAMALNPAMPGLRTNLGLAFFKNGDYKQAIQVLDPLLKAASRTSPEAQRLTVLVGMSHYGLAEFAAATPYLKQAADRDPLNLTLLLTLAHSCLLSRQYKCVLDTYHRMIALNAESAEVDMLMGEALDEMKNPVDATRKFRDAVKADPKEPNVHFGLGYLLWKQGQTQEAAQQFQAELANDPHHLQAMFYLADSDIQMNQMEEARPLLEKLVKINPQDYMVHLDLGILYIDEDRKQDALTELQTAAKLEPSDVRAHWQLARLYRAMGKTVQAKVELDKTRNLNKAADDHLLKIMSGNPHAPSAPQDNATAPTNK